MASIQFTIFILMAVSHTMARPIGPLDFPSRRLATATCTVTNPFTFTGLPSGDDLTPGQCDSSTVVTSVAATVSIGGCNVPVTVTSTDSASTGTPGCQSFTRTFTASECYTGTDVVKTANFTLHPPTIPTITATPATSGTFACSAFPSDATVLGTYSAADSCGNNLTVATSVGTWTKVAGQCKATTSMTYDATDCYNQSATRVTATATYTATGATVTVTPPASVLTCDACANGAYRTVTKTTTCGTTTVGSWLDSASAAYTCASTVGTSPTVTDDFPSAGTNSTVTVTFSASNDCASDTATKQLKVCNCSETCSPSSLRSKGYWQGGAGKPVCKNCIVNGTACSGTNAATCGTLTTKCQVATGSSAVTDLCTCIDQSGGGVTVNCWQQLAAMYLDYQSCTGAGNTGGSTAFPKATLLARSSTCAYLTGSTLTPADIFSQSYALALANSTLNCPNIAGCIGAILSYYDGSTDQICTGLLPTAC